MLLVLLDCCYKGRVTIFVAEKAKNESDVVIVDNLKKTPRLNITSRFCNQWGIENICLLSSVFC